MRRPLALALLALLAALAAAAVPASAAAPDRPVRRPATVDVQVLALNDFHGNLEAADGLAIDPVTGGSSGGVPAGGVEHLASQVRALEEGVRNSIVVSAGDLVGASPLLSALFHDEPTVEAMDAVGLDLNAVGNHEFDEGAAELRRLQEGGCHPADGCADGTPFAGAGFDFLAANVVDTATGEPFFPRYAIRSFRGARVAFVGMTLEGTPSIVNPAGVAGLEFRDEADTVNALVPELRRRGVESIVVLVHEGGRASGGINGCEGVSGAIVDIVERLDDEVDVVISGHTHQAYNCEIDGRLVTSASSFGRVLTDVDLTIDRRTRDVVRASAENLVVRRDTNPPAPDLTALLDRYRVIASPLADRVIGTASGEVRRAAAPSGESPLGNLIADAQLAATDDPGTGEAVVAFMNPGGVRADLGAGPVTYAEAFTVQPFGNSLVTMTLTGLQLDTLLESQFCQTGSTPTRVLAPSEGFAYTYAASAPCGAKVDPATVVLDGAPVDPAAAYRVTVNSFLADGGDGFAVLRDGTDRLGGPIDLDAFESAFAAAPDRTLGPPPTDRITALP